VQLQQVYATGFLYISWWCVQCGDEWPIDELRSRERRSGVDRRRVSRGGRRKP
jgi:hypothetical protein